MITASQALGGRPITRLVLCPFCLSQVPRALELEGKVGVAQTSQMHGVDAGVRVSCWRARVTLGAEASP